MVVEKKALEKVLCRREMNRIRRTWDPTKVLKDCACEDCVAREARLVKAASLVSEYVPLESQESGELQELFPQVGLSQDKRQRKLDAGGEL